MKQAIPKDLHYRPCLLSAEELANPQKHLPNFFLDYPLPQTRLLLWKLFKGWLCYASESPAPNEMPDMLLFHERLTALIDAIYIINEQQVNNSSKSPSHAYTR
jgi:hypothetical protein